MSDRRSLLAALDDDQSYLVQIIGRPWVVNNLIDSRGWPTWDFVRRRFEKDRTGRRTAEEVLASLPVIVSSRFVGESYGLWWRSGANGDALLPDERMGLTIGGLEHLGRQPVQGASPMDLATICLNIIRTAADEEFALDDEADWSKVASGAFDIRTGYFSRESDAPVEIVGQVLVHEYIRLAAGTTDFNYEVSYGGGRFRQFQDVHTVREYLTLAEEVAEVMAPSNLPVSPLALPAALDYLGLLLRGDHRWSAGEAFIDLPGFEAAASICQVPATRAEFDQRCSDLWNIIGRLRVPIPGDSDYRKEGWDPGHKGSLNNLVIWLKFALGSEAYAGPCEQAISNLRRVGEIRQGSQHYSQSTQIKRQTALSQFGVFPGAVSWARGWDLILERCAESIYAITTAVRLSQR